MLSAVRITVTWEWYHREFFDKIVHEEVIHIIDAKNIFIEKVKAANMERAGADGAKKKSYIKIFGCQMNAADGEKIQWLLSEMDYEITDSEKEADLIVYITCCVRENAENKVFGNLSYLKHRKKDNPDLKIVICGCMVQQDVVIEKIKKSYRFVDVIFGTFNLHRFPEYLYSSMETGGQIIDIWKEHGEELFDGQTVSQVRSSRFKASVNIMFGCDNYCTYCIVPYVRGRERSRAPADIITEVESLAHDGVKEVTLLGQNVNSYGTGLAEKTSFHELLREINEIDGIERIRFMTSHPKDLSDELIDVIRDCEKVCKHIHLPFQSGSTGILGRMNRKYTKEDYLQLVERLRSSVPDIAITTDIIVGFPHETEEDFLQTVEVVEKVRFFGAFTFLYSKRTGTPAAEMDGQVPEDVAKDRFQRLVDRLNMLLLEENKKLIGSVQYVLAEEAGTSAHANDISGENGYMLTGRDDKNRIVHFEGEPDYVGDIVPVEITDVKTFYLSGRIIRGEER